MATLAEQVAALGLPPMTDEEMGKYLGLPPPIAAKHVATLTSEDRAIYNQMHAVEVLIPRWQSGIDPYPSDVSVNRGRGKKQRKAPTPVPEDQL